MAIRYPWRRKRAVPSTPGQGGRALATHLPLVAALLFAGCGALAPMPSPLPSQTPAPGPAAFPTQHTQYAQQLNPTPSMSQTPPSPVTATVTVRVIPTATLPMMHMPAASPVARPATLDLATTRLSEGQLFRVTRATQPTPIVVNALHTWTIHIETAGGTPVEGATIGVGGDMPEHGHGLPTQPEVTQYLGNGDYLVEGMLFQMPGWWIVDFDIAAGGQTDRVRFNLLLE